jgi:hypothetical protein
LETRKKLDCATLLPESNDSLEPNKKAQIEKKG